MVGRMKAIGVQVRAPETLKNLSREFQTISATTIDSIMITARFTFLQICRFLVLGQPLYRYPSITELAGKMTRGYEKIRLKMNAISTHQMKICVWGRDWVIRVWMPWGFSGLKIPNAKIVSSEKIMYSTAIELTTMTKMR